MKRILVIQTSFIGDVILATSLLESLHKQFPEAGIELLVRKGNESLFHRHPYLNQIHVWDKSHGKFTNLFKLILGLRKNRIDLVVNAHRFLSSGLITWLSGASKTIGFDKNPLSSLFTHRVKHSFSGKHEIQRNHELIADLLTETSVSKPRLYPSPEDYDHIKEYQSSTYSCAAPTSVWQTKQWPASKWIEMINTMPEGEVVYLLGAPADRQECERIVRELGRSNVVNLCGKLSLLQSAALMESAKMNYTNDSAPMHLASSVNAPTTAIYCSTIPEFGFGPLSTHQKIVQTSKKLECRPCGLHGHTACPKGHFDCALTIDPLSVV